MSEVLINPDQVVSKVESLDALTKRMKAKVEEVHGLAKSIKESWQDTAQENFEADFSKLSQGFESFSDALPEFTQQAQSHAELMRSVGQNG